MNFENVEFSDLPNDCIARSILFQKAISGAATRVTDASKVVTTKFEYFHQLSLALLIRTILCKQGQVGSATKEMGDRISLIATFVQGVNCTKDVILGGYHYKAAGALKQDYELLTRIREIQAGKAKEGATPNVRHAPSGSQRLYGGLNDLAHPSNENLILRHLTQHVSESGVHGVNPFPSFVERTTEVHYWTHVWLTFEICRESVKLLAENYGWEDPHVRDCVMRFETVQNQGILCGVFRVTA